MTNSEKLRRIANKIRDGTATIDGIACAIEIVAIELETEAAPAQWWGIWFLPDDGWFMDRDSQAVLAFFDHDRAKRVAADEFGYDDYAEAVKDGWCEVRPLTSAPPVPAGFHELTMDERNRPCTRTTK